MIIDTKFAVKAYYFDFKQKFLFCSRILICCALAFFFFNCNNSAFAYTTDWMGVCQANDGPTGGRCIACTGTPAACAGATSYCASHGGGPQQNDASAFLDAEYCTETTATCGAANGNTYSSTPSGSSLCHASDTASAVTFSAPSWNWTCTQGTSTVSCSAQSCSGAVDGVCKNSTQNGCTAGTADDAAIPDDASYFKWSCNGENGGANAVCLKAKSSTTPGGCGSAVANSCTNGGTAFDISSDVSNDYWKCHSPDGGVDSGSCQKAKSCTPGKVTSSHWVNGSSCPAGEVFAQLYDDGDAAHSIGEDDRGSNQMVLCFVAPADAGLEFTWSSGSCPAGWVDALLRDHSTILADHGLERDSGCGAGCNVHMCARATGPGYTVQSGWGYPSTGRASSGHDWTWAWMTSQCSAIGLSPMTAADNNKSHVSDDEDDDERTACVAAIKVCP